MQFLEVGPSDGVNPRSKGIAVMQRTGEAELLDVANLGKNLTDESNKALFRFLTFVKGTVDKVQDLEMLPEVAPPAREDAGGHGTSNWEK